MRRVLLDITPLRVSRDFRLIWTGLLVSEVGWQFSTVAVFIQIRRLTGSTAATGLTGLVWLVALSIGTTVGGSFIDALDRRRVLIVSQLGFAAASAILLLGALAGHPPLVLIYGALAVMALFSAIDSPTRSAMTPRLVGKELIPSAQALNQVIWNGTGLVGPMLAGIVIRFFGLEWAYGIDLVTYGAMILAAFLIKPMPPLREGNGERTQTGLGALREGFGYLRGKRVLQSTFAIDLNAMIFGMPRALFPFLAASRFHGGDDVVGYLFAAPAIGALLGALTGGWVRHVKRQGMAVIWAVVLWGAGITAFGLVGDHLPLAMLFLAFAGAADVISAIFRSTILQLAVPDHLRGRLSGIHILVVTGGPRLGDLEAGLIAAMFTPGISVISGGLLCIAGAVATAFAYPELRRYRAGEGH